MEWMPAGKLAYIFLGAFQHGLYVCNHVLVLLVLLGERRSKLDVTCLVLGGEGARVDDVTVEEQRGFDYDLIASLRDGLLCSFTLLTLNHCRNRQQHSGESGDNHLLLSHNLSLLLGFDYKLS